MWPPVLLLAAFCGLAASGQQFSYTRNCIDEHHKDIKCTVEIVDCDADLAYHQVANSSLVPGEAHDIRIEPVAKTSSRRQAEAYHLSVDVSFQTPPNNSTRLLQGFFVEIESDDQKTRLCFLFNVSETDWTPQAIASSPRLHFSTENLFRFDQKYDVTVSSLPESVKKTSSAHKHVQMPHNPRSSSFSNILSPNCSKYSHPYASKWTAGFRKISLNSIHRSIEVQFVGAPPQYCFEQYEVRLLDETGLELLHSDVISVDQMSAEVINNRTMYFGEYTFGGLVLNKSYIPSVIAVERAADGRCLCPVHGTDPYDSTVVCSCIGAESNPIKLPLVITEGTEANTNTSVPNEKEPEKVEEKESSGWWGRKK
ncbi:hypothetical protein M3Y99_01665700 [Aphelenchoides fujianensis]|nr:hypothetical protein M3Y99_01665700 [Aphelenchoides fujianensis]